MAINARPTYNPDNVVMMDFLTGEVPYDMTSGIITEIKNGSAIMKLAKAVPMDKPIVKFTHMSGIGAYWVNETERIRTSKPTFIETEMRSYKLGVILPTSKENLYYSMSDYFNLMKPEFVEAFAKKFDLATLQNVDNPYAFSVVQSATTAGNVVTETANKYTDLNTAMGMIEANDLDPNGIATTRAQRAKYRATVDGNGRPIFNEYNTGSVDEVLGLPIAYMPKGSLGTTVAEIVADWNNAYYGVLQNIEYDITDKASLTTLAVTDPAHTNPTSPETQVMSLWERDSWAIRATMEIGFMVVKDEAFAVINKAGDMG